MARRRREPARFQETSFWQSYSDMMAGVLLMFILIICGTLFILMQVKNSYDASEIELQQRQEELEQAIIENLGYIDLTAAQSLLLADQQSQLDEQQATLDEQQATLEEQQAQLARQQAALEEAQAALAQREAELKSAQALLATQQATLSRQQEALDNQQIQIEQIIGVKRELIAALSDAFAHSDLSISIDQQTGAITMDSSVLFDYDSAELSKDGGQTLAAFLPDYFDVVLSEDYIDYIAEIIIEGHTDPVGSYVYNLSLSQARAEAVAAYCLDDKQTIFDSSLLDQVRSLVSVSGRSWSSPVYDEDGNIDADASRRVEIKFRLSDEEMIDQMLDVLAQYE